MENFKTSDLGRMVYPLQKKRKWITWTSDLGRTGSPQPPKIKTSYGELRKFVLPGHVEPQSWVCRSTSATKDHLLPHGISVTYFIVRYVRTRIQ